MPPAKFSGWTRCQVACEGRFAAFVPEADAARALAILRARDGTARASSAG